jgi:hypothetical protein
MESRSHLYKEKNLNLRERIIELEGIVERLKESELIFSREEPSSNNSEEPQLKSINQISYRLGKDLVAEADTLRKENLEMKAQLIELRTKLDHSSTREDEMRHLIEELRRLEVDTKARLAVRLEDAKREIEDRYILDIKELTEAYEQDRKHFLDELNDEARNQSAERLHRNQNIHSSQSQEEGSYFNGQRQKQSSVPSHGSGSSLR